MKKYNYIDALNEVASYCTGCIKEIPKLWEKGGIGSKLMIESAMENSQYQDVIDFIEELKSDLAE
jgi:hypothetical protein